MIYTRCHHCGTNFMARTKNDLEAEFRTHMQALSDRKLLEHIAVSLAMEMAVHE